MTTRHELICSTCNHDLTDHAGMALACTMDRCTCDFPTSAATNQRLRGAMQRAREGLADAQHPATRKRHKHIIIVCTALLVERGVAFARLG